MKSSQFANIPKPHLFAHRGGNGAGNGKENTKRAFASAVHMGYKFLETDVILTKDKQVICYHGAQNWYTRRKSGLEIRRKVQKLAYEQIQDQIILGNEPVPKLRDILVSFPRTMFSIDVKTKEVVKPLVELLKELKVEDRVIITSFNLPRTLKANRLLRGKQKQASLCLSGFSIWLATPFRGVILYFLKSLGVRYLQISYKRITKKVVKAAHQQGVNVYVWTVNDKQLIRKMLSVSVDGVMSDKSKLLLETAKNKKA